MKKVLFLLMAAFAWIQANAVVDPSVNYIEKWGRLKLVGNQLSDEKGNKIQLKGWSSFGFYDENCLQTANDLSYMKQQGANCVRIARYLSSYGSIDDNGIKGWMQKTNDAGMYCIIDWHILEAANDGTNGNPNAKKGDAKNFFSMVAREVNDKNYRHVIYEVCNEPSGCGWGEIKSYAEDVINTITSIDQNKPIVIVGTPNWDQYIYSQVASTGNLIKTDKAGVMYAFHLYANEPAHQGLESAEFIPASTRVPIFVSEWGLSSAQPEKRASYSDVNTAFAQTFMSHCNGEGGCGQVVSWMNWSYGRKPEGASTFEGSCGGKLSPSGEWIVRLLGGDVDLKPKPTACYGGECLILTKTSEDETLNLGFYNDNPDKQDGDLASCSGITYYDANNTSDEGYTKETATTYNEKELVNCALKNKDDAEPRDILKCYAGRDWCDFRGDECVDVTGACVEGSWSSGLYNLGWICAGEWLLYTFDVKDAGYYSMQMAYCMDKTKGGIGSMKCNDDTGECEATGRSGFTLTLQDHASQTFMVDWDKSTSTEEVAMSAEQYGAYVSESVSGKEVKDENDKVWCFTGDSKRGTTKTTDGILFKEPGKYVVKLSFPFGHLGLGGLRFTYEKPWTGEGYPEEVETSVEKIVNNEDAVVYPSVVADGIINVVADGEANVKIFNLIGAEVYSASIEGSSALSVNLAAGVYSVEVATAEGSKFAKIIVK